MVVDTTYFFQNMKNDLEELRKLTNSKVGRIINTHYHRDHTWGNHLLTCPIVAHKECPKLMRKVRKQQIAEMLREEKNPEVKKVLRKLRLRYPSILFEESYHFDSSPEVEVIHVGGHTPDLSVVYIPEESILFASDNLFGPDDTSTPSHPYMALRSDLPQWILALERMQGLEAKTIVPGHFGLCDKQAIGRLIEYLGLFMTNLKELKDQGYTKEQIRHRTDLLGLPNLATEVWIQNNIETQYSSV